MDAAQGEKRVRMDEAGSPSAFFLSPAASGAAAHVPQRTCIGCRKTDDQAVLMRLVAVNTVGNKIAVRVDEHRRMSGRGSEEHTSELQSHYSISYAVFCLDGDAANISDSVFDRAL